MSRTINLTGKIFDHLTVLRIAESPNSTGHSRWVCHCRLCNKDSVHLGYDLRKMKVTMCKGCSKKLSLPYSDEIRFPSKSNEYRLLCHARERAKERDIPCTIGLADIVIPEFCPVLKIKLVQGKGRHCDSSPTIDRIVPSIGYTPSNTWVISYKANHLKANGTLDDFESLCREMRARMGITPIGPATVATDPSIEPIEERVANVWMFNEEEFNQLEIKEAQ